jgi:hypothetical protein
MTKSGILAAAAILASTLAGPAMAQEVVSNPGYCAQFYPNANCQTKGPGNPYTGSYQRQVHGDHVYRDQTYRDRGWRDGYNRWEDGRVWSGDVTVAGTVGATIAGEDYARRNGFVCVPGTWFRGEDGRMHICQ